MSNKQKNILVWIFTWAALLLIVLYSPIGSPDLYSSSDYYVGTQNANFKGGNIENAQNSDNVNFGSGNDYNELNVPDYNTSQSDSKHASGNYSYATSSGNNTSSGAASYSTSESQSYQNLKNNSAGSNNVGGGNFISNNGSRGSSDASSSVSMNGSGITSLSSTSSTTKNPGDPYNPTGVNDGGQHPGGNPDQGTRAPMPDGWGFLLLLAASYGILKKRFFTK